MSSIQLGLIDYAMLFLASRARGSEPKQTQLEGPGIIG